MRSVVIGFTLAASGLALFLGAESWSQSMRLGDPSVFDEREIDLGHVFAGTVHRLRIPFHNPFDEEAFLFGVDTTCGCVAAELDRREIGPGASGEIQVFVSPKVDQGSFSEVIRLQSSSAELDQQGLRIVGEVSGQVRVADQADFGIKDPSVGASTEIIVGLEAGSIDLDEIVGTVVSARVIADPGARYPLRVEPGYWESAQGGGENTSLVGSFMLQLEPCSLQGRIAGVQVVVDLPTQFGGGQFRMPVMGSLTPKAVVDPLPIIQRELISEQRTSAFFFTVRPRPGSMVAVSESSGESSGFSWTAKAAGEEALIELKWNGGVIASSDSVLVPVLVDGAMETLIFNIQDEAISHPR